MATLSIPQNVSAISDTISVTVSFQAVSGAASYDILFDGKVKTVSSTKQMFSGLTPDTKHTYAVRAKNASTTGAYSAAKTISTTKTSLPVPTNIRQSSTTTSATISWNPVSGASSYEVQFNGTTYTVSGTSKTFTGLTVGRAYTYKLRAKSASNTSAYTSLLTVTAAPPAPVVSAASTADSVTLSWAKVTGATSYRIKFNNGNEIISVGFTSTFKNLKPNTSYTYQVCSCNGDGTGPYSAVKTIKTGSSGGSSGTTLAVPSGITASAQEKSVTISWASVSGATSYDVKVNGSVYRVTTTTKTVTGLIPGTVYSCQVRANNAKGSSAYSQSISVTTIPNPPAVPTGISATATADSATVKWNTVTGATGYTLLFNNRTYPVSTVSKTVTGLASGTSYSYQVRAENAGGSSAYSTAKTIKTAAAPPAVPSNISTTATDNSVTITWSPAANATSYEVLFRGSTYGTTETTKTLTGLTKSTVYSCQVRAKNGTLLSAYSPAKNFKTAPNAPATNSVNASDNSLKVIWGSVNGATSYDVLFDGVTYRVTETSKTFTGLKANTEYSYQVRVNTADGSSSYSAVKKGKTAPGAPAGCTAAVTSNSVTVSWNQMPGAASYDVLFQGSTYRVTGATSKTFTGLQAGTAYTWQVRSNGAAGSSAYTSQIRFTTHPNPPAVPTGITAESTKNSVTIRWAASAGAASYDVACNGSVIRVTVNSCTVSGLEDDTLYTYQVRANNAGGSSAYSQAGKIKTLLNTPGIPTGISAAATDSTVTVSWKAVRKAAGYELLFNGKVYAVSGLSNKISGLTANTIYNYQVRAKNAAGAGSYSSVLNVRTRLATPAGIQAAVTADSVTVSWNPVAGATSYTIRFQGTDYTQSGTARQFTGLMEDTSYTFSVCAKNSYVESAYSGTQTARTLYDGPAEPADIKAEAARNRIVVGFEPVSGAADYDIEWNGVVHPVKAAAGKKRINRVFTGLKQNTWHSYRVRANHAKKKGRYSSVKKIKTGITRRTRLAGGRKKTYPDGRKSYIRLDPINVVTGAFLWSYTWLEDAGKDGLHFTTMYDSQRDEPSQGLGRKWSHSFQYLLETDSEYAYFTTPYGDVAAFLWNAETNTYVPAEESDTELTITKSEDGAYVIREADGTEYCFDHTCHLQSLTDNGLITYCFESDLSGRITTIRGRHGAELHFTYTEDGHVGAVSDVMGNEVSFTYQEDKMTSVMNPDGEKLFFTYDEADNLLTAADFNGAVYLTNEYDEQERVISQVTGEEGKSHVEYDVLNRKTYVTEGDEETVIYTYDEKGNVITIESAGAGNMINQYNDKGQLISQQDPLGNITKLSYDTCGRMNHVTHPDGTSEQVFYDDRNQPIRVINRDETECSYQYDSHNNLIAIQDERGYTAKYSYDEKDNLISYTDKNGMKWSYAYDENNHLSQANDPDGKQYLYSHDRMGRLLSYTSPEGNHIVYEYSAIGNLLSIRDQDGILLFEYNKNGALKRMTDRQGSRQRMEYNRMGRLSLMTDFMGNQYQYAYNTNGNLVRTTDPLGYEERYSYDSNGNQITSTDKNGNITSYSYDKAQQVTEIKDAAGGSIQYTYDTMGRLLSVTNPLNHQTSFLYDRAGHLLKTTDALGNSVSYTYDNGGNILTVTDEEGAVVTFAYDAENHLISRTSNARTEEYTYDGLGRLTAVKDMDGYTITAGYDADGNLLTQTDKEENQTGYVYDKTGRIIEKTDANGGRTHYSYDKNGNCVSMTDAEGNQYSYTYNENNQMTKETDPLGQETVYEYNAAGLLASVTDAKGEKTLFTYDGNGNLTSEVNPLGGRKTYHYDSLNRLIECVDEEGHRSSYRYDAAGNPITCTDANENQWSYAYDALNRLTGVTAQDGSCLGMEYTKTGRLFKVTDQEGAVTSYRYDAAGRLVQITDALEHSTGFTYDSLGRVLTQTDENGNTTEYAYSPAGNLISIKDAEGNSTTYTYNALGQMLSQTDALGNVTEYEYDKLGQTISVTDAKKGKVSFTYTQNGRIATVTDEGGNVTRYSYDACGNLIRTENPLGGVVEYEYDAMNNQIKECLSADGGQSCVTLYQYDKRGFLLREINPLGEEKSYAYDGNGNLITIIDEEKNQTSASYNLYNLPVQMNLSDGKTASFRYNKRGELVELRDWNGTTVMEQDRLGHVTKVTEPDGKSVGYRYDPAGNRICVNYPDNSMVTYAYDKLNRLKTVTDAEGKLTQYAYDAVGNVLSVAQPGNTVTYAYDQTNRPVQVKYQLLDGTAMEEKLLYDALGHIVSSVRSGTRTEFEKSTAFSYDALGRLISYKEGQDTESYRYDALGNRIERKINGSEKAAYQYNAMNQMVSMTQEGIPYRYGYDRRGNLIEETKDNRLIRQYRYDSTNHMVLGKNLENGGSTEYRYNGLALRVGSTRTLPDSRNVPVREVSYTSDYVSPTANELMTWEKGAGSVRTVFGRGYERLSQMRMPEHSVSPQPSGGKSYFQSDLYGSPLFAAGEQGNQQCYVNRNIWGEGGVSVTTQPDLPDLTGNLRFTTYDYDQVTGRYYAQARFYDSAQGRMFSPDPVKRGLNGYPYCDNDPVDYTDPTGEILNVLAGGLAGAAVGGALGFAGSALSQLASGKRFSTRKALGAAASGAITGMAKGALIGSGAGLGVSLLTDFAAGAIGSAAEQRINRRRVNVRKSITNGLTNAVSGAIFGNNPFRSMRSAVGRGAASGAATAGIRHLSNLMGNRGRSRVSNRSRMDRVKSPYARRRDPRSQCGPGRSQAGGMQYGRYYGYQYRSSRPRRANTGFRVGDFIKDVAVGALMGGLSGAAFYGAGKAVEVLERSVWKPEQRLKYDLQFFADKNGSTQSDNLKSVIDIMKSGTKTADGKNIIATLDDNSQVIFRMDVGDNAHKMINYGYPDPTNHINIEIQTAGSSSKFSPKWNFHMMLDEMGKVEKSFITGLWKNR